MAGRPPPRPSDGPPNAHSTPSLPHTPHPQLPDPDAIPAAAKACGLELALTDEGAISSFNEGHLHDVGLRLLQQHLARKGYIRVFDHVYVPARQLFGEKAAAGSAGSAAATAPRFLEGIKLLPLLDTRTTEPFAAGQEQGGGGVLGLSISFEPQVYKWVPVDWAAVQAFAARRRQVREGGEGMGVGPTLIG